MTAVRWNLLLLAFAASLSMAQVPPPPPAAGAAAFSQQELDQMLAPIALYPDALLSQILMAATYPLEVVEAARWSRAHPGLPGEEAVSAAATQPWDPSVKSLIAFPQILSLMDQRLDWTQRLGNAFLAQEPQVMDTVQELRRRAYAAGNLRPSEHVLVEEQAGTILIVPANPQVFYVPYYDPLVVFGPWWWPAYPPVFWPPWPGYVPAPGISVGFVWGAGVAISAGFFFGALDWPHHRVAVANVRPFYYRPGHERAVPGVWRHEPVHRRGVPYRTETVRREFGRPAAPPGAAPRLEYRGRESPAPRTAPAPVVRPQATAPAPVVRPQATAPARTQAPAQARAQPSAPIKPQARAPAPQPAPRAFEGIRAGGAKTREYSARGQASMSRRAAPPAAPAGAAKGRR